jgi:excisionase family DNA binding protein
MSTTTTRPLPPARLLNAEQPRITPAARLLNAEQAAAYLNVPCSWVREAARARRIPSVVVSRGKHIRFLQEDLDAWIAERRVDACR